MIDRINTDIAKAENCNDKVIMVNNVTVIKKDVLGFKKTAKVIAKNGNGSKNTDQWIGSKTANVAIKRERKDTMDKCLLSKNFGSNILKYP